MLISRYLDFNSEISGSRYRARSGSREQLLSDLLSMTGLYSPVSDVLCKGPSYTFDPYESGLNRSLIDHVLLDSSKHDLVSKCSILDDNKQNMSDHLPIVLTLDCQGLDKDCCTVSPKHNLKWNKLPQNEIKSRYTDTLDISLGTIDIISKTETDHQVIDAYYNKLIKICTTIAANNIPKGKFNTYLKPKWSQTLKPLYQKMGYARHNWINNGRPGGSEHISYVKYKEAKRNFRRELRLLQSERDREVHEMVDHQFDIDINQFWKYIKRKRSRKSAIGNEMKFTNGHTCRNSKDITEGWASYFSELYKPLSDPTFDIDHFQKINKDVKEYLNGQGKANDILDSPIDVAELSSACKSLHNGKAAGYDGLMNEHLKYGGTSLYTHLSCLFSAMLYIGYVPPNMKKGVIITIIKDNLKSKSSPNNYRGITLLSAVYKILEKVLLTRIKQFSAHNSIKFPDLLQFAYQEKLSALHASFTLQEVINYNIERSSKVYTCLLDSSKAFDVVWIDGLFYKLYKFGICGNMWRLLYAAYTDMKSSVMFNGIYSRWFCVKQSVRQGGVLSPWLYLLYLNDMLVELRSVPEALRIGNLKLNYVAQADDVAILSLTPKGLQHLLDIVYAYSRKWRFKHNVTKTKIMVFGESKRCFRNQDNRRVWLLGPCPISQVDSYKHLGIVLQTRGSHCDKIDEACRRGKGSFMSLAGVGVRPNGLNPLTSSNLLKLIVYPRSLYGCELWNHLTENQLLQLERMQRFCIKLIQGFPKRTRSDKATCMLGMVRMQALISRYKFTFFRQLLALPAGFVVKQILIIRFTQHLFQPVAKSRGFMPDIFSLAQLYNLPQLISSDVLHGNIPDKCTWEDLVTSNILAYELSNYEDRTSADPDYCFFKSIHPSPFSPSPMWLAAKCVPGSLPMLSYVAKLAVCIDQVNCTQTLLCEFCGLFYKNPIIHVLTSCYYYSNERDRLWDFISNYCSVHLEAYLVNLSDEELVSVMLGCPFPDEIVTSDIMHYILLYRFSVYIHSIKHVIDHLLLA